MNCTVLIPAFNVSNWIGEAIESVMAQTYRSWDILVVDDGSSDGTCEVVDHYLVKHGLPISLLRLSHKGPANATHQGIVNAVGPVVTVLDGDDRLFPNSLETVMPVFLNTRSKVGFAWSMFVCSNGGKGWSRGLPKDVSLWEAIVYKGWWNASHQRFLLRDVYMGSQYQLDPSIPYPSDLALAICMASTGCNVRWVPKVTYWYRVNRLGSISRSSKPLQKKNAQRLIHLARSWDRERRPKAV